MLIFELANEMILSVSNVLSTILSNNHIYFVGQILLSFACVGRSCVSRDLITVPDSLIWEVGAVLKLLTSSGVIFWWKTLLTTMINLECFAVCKNTVPHFDLPWVLKYDFRLENSDFKNGINWERKKVVLKKQM